MSGEERGPLGLISSSQLSRDPLPSFSHRGQGAQNRSTSWLTSEGPPHTRWHVLLLLLPRSTAGIEGTGPGKRVVSSPGRTHTVQTAMKMVVGSERLAEVGRSLHRSQRARQEPQC